MITTTPSGLQYVVVKEGMGARKPLEGQVVTCHYCGWLGAFEAGDKFDSSRDRGKEFQTQVGVGAVIQGWDECLLDMKRKEQRMVIIPPELGYGERGAGNGAIPPGATLYFHIELLKWA
jgi:peptidylprolyl isomerase